MGKVEKPILQMPRVNLPARLIGKKTLDFIQLGKFGKKTFSQIVIVVLAEREPQTICYLTNWSHKRPGAGRFMPEDIDPTLCTHVVYAFATLKDHLLTESSEKDGEMYERLIALREKNPDIKVSPYLPANLFHRDLLGFKYF